MQLIDVKLGSEGDANVTFSQGKISIALSENTPGLTGALTVSIPVTYFVDALVKKLGSTPTEVAIGALLDSVLTGIA